MDRIALGIDLNITTGVPVLAKEEIPTLVREDGRFYSSWERRRLDEASPVHNHVEETEVIREFEAQTEAFIRVLGRKPDYIHAHAYTTKRMMDIQRSLAAKYRIPYSDDVYRALNQGMGIDEGVCPWYQRPATLENQMRSSLKRYLLDNRDEFLKRKSAMIIGHMGFVDQNLFELSSYTLYRVTDLSAMTDPEVINWAESNEIQLITYKEWGQ